MANPMVRLRAWLDETHSTGFELRRHFFLRFFDSELVSSPAQWKVVAGGALAMLLSFSIIYTQAYYHKYRLLNELDSPEPYQLAVLADVLFLVTLAMCVVALFTTLQWPSLFPGLRDYLALASLPLRTRDIFVARFTALIALAALVVFATNFLPSIIFPAVMYGDNGPDARWQILGLFVSCTLACWFVFFSLVALQGILLNVLPVRQFPRLSLIVQGILMALLLCALPLVFSMPGLNNHMRLRPEWVLWTPPAWFLGVDQVLVGNREPFALKLAITAVVAVFVAAFAAVSTYVWSYRRHKVRVLESSGIETATARLWLAGLADRMVPNSRELAVFAFVGKMLSRSRQHRLILTAFAALALAVIFESFVSLAASRSFRGFSVHTLALRQVVVSAPLALSLFLLCGFRYLFRLPVELRANWVFRMAEHGNCQVMLAGVERFLVYFAILPVALLTLPMEVRLLGPAVGFAASAVCLLTSLILMEVLLIPFDKIPFTSAYMPGRRPLIETAVRYAFVVGLYVTVLSMIVSWCIQTTGWTLVLSATLLVGWWKARNARMELQRIGRLEFEEQLEPAVLTLSIERD